MQHLSEHYLSISLTYNYIHLQSNGRPNVNIITSLNMHFIMGFSFTFYWQCNFARDCCVYLYEHTTHTHTQNVITPTCNKSVEAWWWKQWKSLLLRKTWPFYYDLRCFQMRNSKPQDTTNKWSVINTNLVSSRIYIVNGIN